MAMIKSALELALERTKNLKVDEGALKAQAAKTSGKKAASAWLDDAEAPSLDAIAQGLDAADRSAFLKGAFEVFAAQIQLPTGEFVMEKIEKAGKGLGMVARCAPAGAGGGIAGASGAKGAAAAGHAAEKQVLGLVQQVSAFLGHYLEDMKKVDQAIRTQWGPKLREKERRMAARMGQDVRLDPMSDPEFSAFYKQNVDAVRQQYSESLEKAKEDLAVLCGIRED